MTINPFTYFNIFGNIIFNYNNRRLPRNRLDRSINQANTTSHSVKEQLLRSQPANKRALYKSTSIWRVIVFGKMRQRPAIKAIWNAFTVNCLLSQARCHLRNINIRAFRTRVYHRNKSIILAQTFNTYFTGIINSSIENI